MRYFSALSISASLALAVGLMGCDQNRKPTGSLDCQPQAELSAPDSMGFWLLPSKKWVALSQDTHQVQTLQLGRQGQYSLVMTFGRSHCTGSSTLELREENTDPAAPHLALNLIYQGKKADTDTLSVLGLLPFEGKVLRCTEVYPKGSNQPSRLRARLRIL